MFIWNNKIMVYITELEVTSTLTNLRFVKKYHISADELACIADYMCQQFRTYSPYGRVVRRFVTRCHQYANGKAGMVYSPHTGVTTQLPFEDFLKQICEGDKYPFYCYFKHDLTDYKCVQFLVEYLANPIDVIIESFEQLNPAVMDITKKIEITPHIYPAVKKILTLYMLIALAKAFYLIRAAIADKNFRMLRYLDGYNFRHIHRILAEYISKGESVEKAMDDSDSQLYLKIFHLFDDQGISVDDFFIKNCTITVYQNIRKLYNFFAKKSVDEIRDYLTKHPDSEAIIGRYFLKRNTVTKAFLLGTICRFDVSILNNFIDEQSDVTETNQIHDLRMPTVNIPTSMIVIEV